MKVLVVGAGGREHALCWKLRRSQRVTEVLCAPGNAGTASVARNVSTRVDDLDGLVALAVNEKAGLVVVGPEGPLCLGLTDRLAARGIPVFGPTRAAAEIEGSKAFAKELMSHAGIPTAGYRAFRDREGALQYLEGEVAWPVVVKASGLAAGKGVVIAGSRAEAAEAVERMMTQRIFGAGGETILIEDFLAGEEASIHCLTDGRTLHVLPTSQDHKKVNDGDEGPNTGGMGAISPARIPDSAGILRIEREVLFPAIHALGRARRPFSGVLYAGLMITRSGVKVLEFNARFGDPETQVILPRLKGDLANLFLAVAEGRLSDVPAAELDWDQRTAVGVVLCSGGYPGPYRKGDVIDGLEAAASHPDVLVFHAGTALRSGRTVTDGGRVLTVVGLGADASSARDRAYAAAAEIRFEGLHYRKDIGARALSAGGG